MRDAIIVLNAGSSSLKFSIYAVHDQHLEPAARGQIEGLGTSPKFKVKDPRGQVLADMALDGGAKSVGHAQAFSQFFQWTREKFGAELKPAAVGHRVVHGGADYSQPTLITAEVLSKLEQLIPLVPLHQPHNLEAVKIVLQLKPDLPQVACFDTAFHRGRASITERFALPDEYFQKGLRRWGFHGLSYESIAGKLPTIAPSLASGRVIVAHLGSGASLCAMHNGKCVDTTMSFSVLDGIPMGTRPGSLDPGAMLYLMQSKTQKEIEDLLYRKSGLLGISGISNDVRVLLSSDQPQAAEAIEYFVYRVAREIGSLTVALGGLDGLVFTAGIGENSPVIRSRICRRLEWMGIAIDDDANQVGCGCISREGGSPQVWVIPTDEEAVIAAGTLNVARSMLRHP